MFIRSFASLVFCLLSLQNIQAQVGAVMVQQPVVSLFGAATTVSVPDRGDVLIGGVNTSASGSTRFGPLPSGFAYGSTMSSTSTRAHVWIHDPAEMDAALLRLGESRVSGLSPGAQGQRARDILRNRSGLSVPILPAERQNFDERARAVQILRSRR